MHYSLKYSFLISAIFIGRFSANDFLAANPIRIDNSREAVYGYDQRIELFGSKGSIAAENNTATRTIRMTVDGTLSERPLDFFLERYQDSFRLEVNEFFESISVNGKITADGEAGLVSILIGLAAKKS
ncbi:hypothetical protein ACFLZD_00460, partial [Candidatus Neomarinimicrobiota bacterium]